MTIIIIINIILNLSFLSFLIIIHLPTLNLTKAEPLSRTLLCMTLLRIVCSCIFCPSAITAADRKYTLYSVSCLLSPLRHAAGPTFYSASGDFRGANATDSKKREGERASVAVTPDYLCCRGAFAAFAAFTAPAAHTAQA